MKLTALIIGIKKKSKMPEKIGVIPGLIRGHLQTQPKSCRASSIKTTRSRHTTTILMTHNFRIFFLSGHIIMFLQFNILHY